MTGLIFEKLEEVNSLKAVSPKNAVDYRTSPDYNKIAQIIEQYIAKYSKDLSGVRHLGRPLSGFKEQLTRNIVNLYEKVEAENEVT